MSEEALKGKRPANAPIPGSARDRAARQAAKVIPLRKEQEDVAQGMSLAARMGARASQLGFALALGLRSKRFKWLLRVGMLVMWFAGPLWLSGVLTVLAIVWCGRGVVKGFKWLVSKAAKSPERGSDTCQCRH